MRTLDREPTTADEFAQSLVDDGLVDWLLDRTPEGESQSDTVEVDSQPRDPKTGRFLPMSHTGGEEGSEEEAHEESPEKDTDEKEPGTEEPSEDEQRDDELAFELDQDALSVLDKYGGDLNKALKALAESQSMIGRQGNELGELRKQLAELTELVQSAQVNPIAYAPYMNSLEENPQGLVQEVLERAAQTGYFDDATYEAAISAWGEEDPFAAARMDARVSMLRQMVDIGLQTGAAASASQTSEATLEEAMSGVVQRHPDIEKYIPVVGEIAKEFPTLRNLMAKGNPSERASAFEELVKIAKARQQSDTSREALKRVVLKTQEEVQREKAGAAVVSAKNRSAATAEPTGLELFYREFDRATGQLIE